MYLTQKKHFYPTLGIIRSGMLLMMVFLLSASPVFAASEWLGTPTNYHSFDLHTFQTDGINVRVAVPKVVAEGKPWVWRARFWGHKPNFDVALLNKGFHIAYVDVAGLFGSPAALARAQKLYNYLTTQHSFNPRAVMEGMSRGGLLVYNWSIQNPDKVFCIYADAPVCDFKSWPAGLGNGVGSSADWTTCKSVYGFTQAQALAYGGNPIDSLQPLATAKIPLFHVVGDADNVVPVAENTAILKSRYEALGGQIEVVHKPGVGHVHGLADPTPIVNFVLNAVPLPPTFSHELIIKGDAVRNTAYNGQTIAGSAIDAPNDTLTYTKVNGSHSGLNSDWLHIAADGALSGMPTDAEVGTHTWSVRVSDNHGKTDYATLKITVLYTAGSGGSNTATPIAGTGWNHDLIAESSASSVSAATTGEFSGFVFYESGLTGTSQGLNASGTYSGTDSTYQIPPYNGNNAIHTSGTFTLSSPGTYSKLAFLVTTQDASGSTWTATVTYSDASTQTLSGTGVDWTHASTQVVVSNHGLVRRNGGTPYTGNLSMVERQFDVDSTKPITSIQFATQSGKAVFHAISGRKSASTDLGAIWFIGDSITQSNADGSSSSSPRKELYDLLTADSVSFSYTGHFTANVDGLPSTGGAADTNLYHYHSGISGSVIGNQSNAPVSGRTDMTAGMSSFWTQGRLATVKPNNILIMLGTNDTDRNYYVDDAPSRLSTLIDTIMGLPGVGKPAIFVAQIPPNLTPEENPRVLAFNAALPDIVAAQRLAGRDVYLVDQYTPINADTAGLMRDTLHTNTAGNKVLAQQWYDGLKKRHIPTGGSSYAAWQFVNFGSSLAAHAGLDQDPDGDGRNNLYEFAFASNPNVAEGGATSLTFEGNAFIITRRKGAAAGVTYTLEESTTLENESWSPVTNVSSSVVSTSGDFETVKLIKDSGHQWLTETRNFLRVRVDYNP